MADIPPRSWFIDRIITTGFNMVVARKSQGKSFLMTQMANAIATGAEFLGRATMPAKVLFVSFELDEGDTSDRFKSLPPLSDNAYLLHTWSVGDKALADTERALRDYGFKVVFFDTFLPLIPRDRDFAINDYGDSEYYLKWRMLAKRYGAAITASWHTGKNEREDPFLDAIGSTGMVGQADSLIKIIRKRGEAASVLFVGGNHAADCSLPVVFEDGMFYLADDSEAADRLPPDEERTLAVLRDHPKGCSPTVVGLRTGKNDNAARATLNRLIARGKAMRVSRGVYALADLL